MLLSPLSFKKVVLLSGILLKLCYWMASKTKLYWMEIYWIQCLTEVMLLNGILMSSKLYWMDSYWIQCYWMLFHNENGILLKSFYWMRSQWRLSYNEWSSTEFNFIGWNHTNKDYFKCTSRTREPYRGQSHYPVPPHVLGDLDLRSTPFNWFLLVIEGK